MLGKSLGIQKDCISIMGLIYLRQDCDIVKTNYKAVMKKNIKK